jgi:dTDP-3,4-didehydro-2,6-dideoxy-alpha-D-glucose 3-reductase
MIRIGIICPSEIALRRFLPALKGLTGFQFAGVAYASIAEWPGANDNTIQEERTKAEQFTEAYGGIIYDSYNNIIQANDINAIYIPLPPALHFQWAEKALAAGKHVLLEKPATTSLAETSKLLEMAAKKILLCTRTICLPFTNN